MWSDMKKQYDPVYRMCWLTVCVFLRRLAKSTLLLIPLFGVNYVVLVYLMEPADKNMKRIKIFFELALGSFQVP